VFLYNPDNAHTHGPKSRDPKAKRCCHLHLSIILLRQHGSSECARLLQRGDVNLAQFGGAGL
jgi:hypothetical protein